MSRHHTPNRERRSAGSAYVETLIVTCLFTCLLVWTLSFGRSRVAMLQGAQLDREAAWTRTGRPCSDQVQPAAHALARETASARAQALLRAALPGAAADTRAAPLFDCNENAISVPRAAAVDQARAVRWLDHLLDQVAP